MKKITALALAALTILTLASCKNEENTETTTAETETEITEETTVQRAEPDTSALSVYEACGYTPLDYSSPALLTETEPADDEYMDSIVYLCDSTLYWLGRRGFVHEDQIWTGKEMTQTLAYQSTFEIYDPYDGVERPIREVARLHKPKRMIICLGTNGIDWMSPDDVYNEFCDLVNGINNVSPHTVIILQSILPMSPKMYTWSGASFDNKKITACNAMILKAAEDKGLAYLDTYSALVGDDGLIKPEYSEDGLHPTPAGQQVIMDYIRTHKYG